MEIVRLPDGVSSKPDDDCIRLQERSDGRFLLIASALSVADDPDNPVSVGLIESGPYDTFEEAEAAGLAWAESHGVRQLHESRSDGTKPLPDPAKEVTAIRDGE